MTPPLHIDSAWWFDHVGPPWLDLPRSDPFNPSDPCPTKNRVRSLKGDSTRMESDTSGRERSTSKVLPRRPKGPLNTFLLVPGGAAVAWEADHAV